MSKEREQSAMSLGRVFSDHPRTWRDFHYIYPVISRRSRGLSIGVNLNVDYSCNFDCVYCCVDRSQPPTLREVNMTRLDAELDQMLGLAASGGIWDEPEFNDVPQDWRRINDIAFSGDGEPTFFPQFDIACALVAHLKAKHHLIDTKIVLITNATRLAHPQVQLGLRVLDANEGEIWAKLDAGTEDHYRRVDRPRVAFDKVLDNILTCGRERPLVIQSLFMQIDGEPVPEDEFDAYLARLGELIEGGCRITLVQLYTVARRTAEDGVAPLPPEAMDRLKTRFRQALPELPVEVYYGPQ